MVLSAERFATDITGIGPLVCVGPLVDEEIVTLGEVSVAIFTDKLLLWPRCASRASEQPRVIAGVEGGGERGLGHTLGHPEHVTHQQGVGDVGEHGLVGGGGRLGAGGRREQGVGGGALLVQGLLLRRRQGGRGGGRAERAV